MLDDSETRIKLIASSISEELGIQVVVSASGENPAEIDSRGNLKFSLSAMRNLVKQYGMSNLKPLVYKEASLALSSDKAILDVVRSDFNPETSPSERDRFEEFKSVLEALERRRAEYKVSNELEGTKDAIRDFNNRTFDSDLGNPMTSVDQKILEGLVKGIGDSMSEESLKNYCETARKEIDIEDFRDIISRVEKASNSKEVVGLAQEFLDKYKLNLEGKKEEEQEQEGGDGEGESEEEKEGEPQIGKPKKEDGKDGKLGKQILKAADSMPEKEDGTIEKPDLPPIPNIDRNKIYYVPASIKAKDYIGDYPRIEPETYVKDKQYLGIHQKRLARKLKDAITVEKARRFKGDFLCGPKISKTFLHKLIASDPKLFAKRAINNKADLCFTILVDLSGSMGGGRTESKIVTARRSVVMLSETLETLRIPYEVIGFTSNMGHPVDSEYESITSLHLNTKTRTEPLAHYIFKGYDEQLRKAKGKIGAMDCHRNNYDGEGVCWAYSRIRQRPEKRKVILVLSDGHPAGPMFPSFSSEDANAKFLKEACYKIERIPGIELYGIGVENSAVEEFYKNHCVIQNAQELPEVLVKTILKTLKAEKKK